MRDKHRAILYGHLRRNLAISYLSHPEGARRGGKSRIMAAITIWAMNNYRRPVKEGR
jgi:hypothetical protein